MPFDQFLNKYGAKLILGILSLQTVILIVLLIVFNRPATLDEQQLSSRINKVLQSQSTRELIQETVKITLEEDKDLVPNSLKRFFSRDQRPLEKACFTALSNNPELIKNSLSTVLQESKSLVDTSVEGILTKSQASMSRICHRAIAGIIMKDGDFESKTLDRLHAKIVESIVNNPQFRKTLESNLAGDLLTSSVQNAIKKRPDLITTAIEVSLSPKTVQNGIYKSVLRVLRTPNKNSSTANKTLSQDIARELLRNNEFLRLLRTKTVKPNEKARQE